MDEEEGMALREVAGQVKALSSERVRVLRVLIRLSPGASANEKKRAEKTRQNWCNGCKQKNLAGRKK